MRVIIWVQAGLIGFLAGAGFLIGAFFGFLGWLPHRAIAVVMGFGAGVLVAVVTLELVLESSEHGSIAATASGLILGALLFSSVNWLLGRHGGGDRKRCGDCVPQPSEELIPGSGLAIAAGALLDGVPESMAIGLSVAAVRGVDTALTETSVSVALVAGFFLANIPQGLSSASGMREAGRSRAYTLGVWAVVATASAVAAVLGAVLFARASSGFLAGLHALAAGGVIAMLAETMIPEAFHLNMTFIGTITALGFMVALLLGAIS